MSEIVQESSYASLTGADVPGLYDHQLAAFTLESMHAQAVRNFDPARAVDALQHREGNRVLAADFGGDKGTSLLLSVQGGSLVPTEGYEDHVQGDDGDGYVTSMEKTARYADEHQLPFGISWGGPIDGTKPLPHPKARKFIADLQEKYGGDLGALSSCVKAVLNDGPAGVVGGAVEAYRRFGATDVLFIINGGGIGMGVLKDGLIYATEAGHVEGVPELNSYGQSEACGVYGAEFVCLERLGANKAGIEAQWQTRTGQYMRARDIEGEYKAGNEFAGELYDHSAFVVAHVIQGTAKAFGIDLTAHSTAIVGHGGAFKFPDYGKRIRQILETYLGGETQLIMTKDFVSDASNACLDGAAVAALTAAD